MAKEVYSLVGVDGNAFAIMGYTHNCLEKENFSKDVIDKMYDEAQSDTYYHLIAVCMKYVEMANEAHSKRGNK